MQQDEKLSDLPKKAASVPARPRSRQTFLYRFLIADALVISLLATLALVSGFGTGKPGTAQGEQPLPQSTLSDINGLNQGAVSGSGSPNRTTYVIEGTTTMHIGIDVSEHQGYIDWDAVAGNGIEFAIVRVGARGWDGGAIIHDSQFQNNIEGAKRVGIKVGVYFYSQAVTEYEAREEADFVLDKLNGRALDFPIVFDLETDYEGNARVNYLSSAQRSANARAFCERIEAAGYHVMLYGNVMDLFYFDAALLAKYDIWFAEYNVPQPSNYGLSFSIWQFTSSGVVAGISTYVDLNVLFSGTDERRLPDNVVVHEIS
jgi:GH25 family lysozyme M1 (1,4-beta-N-acetylmuramidase)